jgi:hypothetical protein
MYNIVTGNLTEVTTGNGTTGYDTGGFTDIDSDKIVYVKRASNDPSNPYIGIGDIYVYCIATGKSTQLFASRYHTSKTPVVSGNVVVWSDKNNSTKDSIYMTEYRCRR